MFPFVKGLSIVPKFHFYNLKYKIHLTHISCFSVTK